MSEVQREALRRASAILGGKAQLRVHLGVSMQQLDAWMSGAERTPTHVFLAAIDVISDPGDFSAERRDALKMRERSSALSRLGREAQVRAVELERRTHAAVARSQSIIRSLGGQLPIAVAQDRQILAHDFIATDFPASEVREMLRAALSAAMNETYAPRGNVQIAAPEGMQIVAQYGFGSPFLDFFAVVTPDTPSCCSEAHRHGRPIVVDDVRTDPIFTGTAACGVMIDAGAISCQSTPLLGNAGEVIGMLSTHYEVPHRASASQLEAVEAICRHASRCLEAVGA